MAEILDRQFYARLVFPLRNPLAVYEQKAQVNRVLRETNVCRWGYKQDSFEQIEEMKKPVLVIRIIPTTNYSGEATSKELAYRTVDALAASTDIQEAFVWITGRPEKCSRDMRVLEAKWDVRSEELRIWELSDEILNELDAADGMEGCVEKAFRLQWNAQQMFKYTTRLVLECEHRDKAMLQGLTGDIVNLIENAGCVRPDFSKLYDVMKPFIKLKR